MIASDDAVNDDGDDGEEESDAEAWPTANHN